MLTNTFYEVLKYEGPVSITSWGSSDTPHVTCTWNSYLKVIDEKTLLIPVAGMTSTQADVDVNDEVILTMAAREVEGFNGYQGTGFRLTGEARFIDQGPEFDEMKANYSFINRILKVKITSAEQLL